MYHYMNCKQKPRTDEILQVGGSGSITVTPKPTIKPEPVYSDWFDHCFSAIISPTSFVIISMLPGQGDLRGWSQALWLLGQKWRMQEESWMVYFKCLIALFACHYWNFDITTQKLITSTRSIYFPLVEAPLFISFTFHFRMLVSCPVSCNQCKNKCDDNNVYCKVAKTSHYMWIFFLNHS